MMNFVTTERYCFNSFLVHYSKAAALPHNLFIEERVLYSHSSSEFQRLGQQLS